LSTSGPHSHFSSEQSRNLIEGEYKNYLKAVKENTNFKNHLILIGLRETLTEDGVREGELKYNTKLNDIYLGSVKMICKAESLNMPLGDSVDVSLKCYLSMLYLKGEYAKITLSTAP
jgi:ribosomal protein L6P/L9E